MDGKWLSGAVHVRLEFQVDESAKVSRIMHHLERRRSSYPPFTSTDAGDCIQVLPYRESDRDLLKVGSIFHA